MGKILAEKSGKELADTDEYIIKKIGMSISDFFAKFGEPEFRRIEKETIAELAETGGKVIATIVCTSPWILDNLEPSCDALLAQYTTSAASLSNAYSAQVDVIVGNYNPTGKLSVTMPSCEAVIALTEVRDADGNLLYEECASPNDVPGYDKDQYMDPEVLAQSPSGSYIYKDADGNSYVSGFGLSN